MILLPPELYDALRTNAAAQRLAERDGRRFDPVPVLKLFNPLGPAMWLATELADDDNTLFGLADLGFGCPELGSFSLSEIGAVRLPYGLGIERDAAFATPFPLSVWADTARCVDSLQRAELLLRRAAEPDPDLPPPQPGGG